MFDASVAGSHHKACFVLASVGVSTEALKSLLAVQMVRSELTLGVRLAATGVWLCCLLYGWAAGVLAFSPGEYLARDDAVPPRRHATDGTGKSRPSRRGELASRREDPLG